jgi:hypothetical protein
MMTKPGSIVCVYGALRSGTTMLRLMLDSHPQLSCPGESDVFFDYLSVKEGNWALDADALKRNWLFQVSGLTLIDGTAQDQVMSLIKQVGKGRERTVLMAHRGLDRVLDVFPDLRVIHIVRDPRDVALSSIGMGWAGNVFHGLDHWLKTEDGWSNALPRMAHNPVLEIRYEDLVQRPADMLTRVCGFLDVPFVPEMLTYDTRTTYSKPDARKIERWRGKLSQRDLGLLEARLGDRLQSRGYSTSGHPLIAPTPVEKVALKLDNKVRIWGRRFKDHGLVDPIAVTVAQRLKMPSVAQRAQKRIEAKVIAGLK